MGLINTVFYTILPR